MVTRTQNNKYQSPQKKDCNLYQKYKKFFIYFHYASFFIGIDTSPTAARLKAVVAWILGMVGMVIGDYLEEYFRNNATSLSLKPISSGIPCPITFHGGRK